MGEDRRDRLARLPRVAWQRQSRRHRAERAAERAAADLGQGKGRERGVGQARGHSSAACDQGDGGEGRLGAGHQADVEGDVLHPGHPRAGLDAEAGRGNARDAGRRAGHVLGEREGVGVGGEGQGSRAGHVLGKF